MMLGKRNLKNLLRPARDLLRLVTVVPLRLGMRYLPWKLGKLAVWQAVSSHLWWLETYVVVPTRVGTRLHVDARETLGRYVYYFGIWEPNFTRWISERLRPGDTFVDVGANIGYFTALGSRLVGAAGHVVAVEAFPPIFTQLQSNIARNDSENVRAVNVAVWDSETYLSIFAEDEHPAGNTTVMPEWADAHHLKPHGAVRAAPLCAILNEHERRRVRLIKVDVEGAEWRLVADLVQILREAPRNVELAIELTSKATLDDSRTPDDLRALMASEGFNCYLIENDYSARAYINHTATSRPRRVTELQGRSQYDVIFSRVEADQL